MTPGTKIVCTLGPATDTAERIGELCDAGMSVARINCSHGDWEGRRSLFNLVRDADDSLGILIDLQGPKFRIGKLKGGRRMLEQGETVSLGPKGEIPLERGVMWDALSSGDRILLGDGEISLEVVSVADSSADCEVLTGGKLGSRKGITLAGRSFDVQSLTDKDREDAREAVRLGADFVALSYVRRGEDMDELRALVQEAGGDPWLVAKIETREALVNLDAIIEASDVIMVARGDLGLQMPMEEVPAAQKHIIRACARRGVPVITATQMLESMMQNARPTRAEASDVANAILDGSDAVMLSGETAAGKHPIKACAAMARIALEAEKLVGQRPELQYRKEEGFEASTDAVARAAVQLADQMEAKALITISNSGLTPRLVAKHRPDAPIMCACWKEETLRRLSIVHGVTAFPFNEPTETDPAIESALDEVTGLAGLKAGDPVVVTAGYPVGTPGSTNMILARDV